MTTFAATEIVDCACCGMHTIAIPGGECDSCAAGVCDSDKTWHCSEVDWCDGTVCELHVPERGSTPKYVAWQAPDGAGGRLRLDETEDGEWWVSRRSPLDSSVVEWIGHVTFLDSRFLVRRFASANGEGLQKNGVSCYARSRSQAVRSLAGDVVGGRLRDGVYGPICPAASAFGR